MVLSANVKFFEEYNCSCVIIRYLTADEGWEKEKEEAKSKDTKEKVKR